jgi:S1-C subfamily serine protease
MFLGAEAKVLERRGRAFQGMTVCERPPDAELLARFGVCQANLSQPACIPIPSKMRRLMRLIDDRDAPRKKLKKSSMSIVIGAIAGGVVAVGGIFLVIVLVLNRDKENRGDTISNDPQQGGPPPMAGAGKGGPNVGDMPAEADKVPLGGILYAKELDPAVRKKIEDATVHFTVKAKEKDIHGAQGSGFLAFEPGIVLTNAHVVDMLEPGSDEPESITVSIHSGQPDQKNLKGKVLAVDQRADLAVVKIDPAGQPAPLVVKSASGLFATQPLYVCGFPLGKQISNSVTIFQSQVASLSKDPKTGILDRVVLASEMQHGNSGGPVVNDDGEVVGVNVAGYEGTRINMAVPGDYVHVIINGRIARMRTGQSSFGQGHVTVPVIAELIDPIGWLRKVEVEVWMGDDTPNYMPPASRYKPPSPRTGDSEHKRYELDLRGDKAIGEFMLPNLSPGKACYWQPVVTYKDKDEPGVTEWSLGEKYTPDQPVYRRGAKLLHKSVSGNRSVTVSVKERFEVMMSKEDKKTAEEFLITMQFDGELMEQPGPADTKGKSLLRLDVHKIRPPQVELPEELLKRMKDFERMDRDRQRVFNSVGQLDLQMQINERGDVERSIAIAMSAPPDIKREVESMGDDILQWLQAVSVQMPNRQMGHLDTWKAKRPFAVLTPFSDLQFKAIDMTYMYLGIRTRNDREEAIVELSGKLRNREMGLRFGCTLEGRALIDLETGLVTMARTTTTMDLDLPLGQLKIPARSTMEVFLQRSLPSGGN